MLAVFDEKRFPDAPDVPTIAEKGIDLISSSTRGIRLSGRNPMEIVSTWRNASRRPWTIPTTSKRMRSRGWP